jgi:hypothetical protein
MTPCYLMRMLYLLSFLILSSLNANAADFCTKTDAGVNLDFNALTESAYNNPKLNKDYSLANLQDLFIRVETLAKNSAEFKQQIILEWCGNQSASVLIDDIFITDWHHNLAADGIESFSSNIHIVAFIPVLARTSDGVFKNYQSYLESSRGKRKISDTFVLVEFNH